MIWAVWRKYRSCAIRSGNFIWPWIWSDLEVLREVVDEVVEGVLVLGEDQQLLAPVLSQAEVAYDVEQLW
jgi:hypothetical protein